MSTVTLRGNAPAISHANNTDGRPLCQYGGTHSPSIQWPEVSCQTCRFRHDPRTRTL